MNKKSGVFLNMSIDSGSVSFYYPQMIESGKLVKIHYTLIVDGNVLESSEESGPLEYEHGRGQIIPGLENALEGLKEGDSSQVDIGPDDAYGPINPELVIEIPRNQVQEGFIEIGTLLRGKDSEGKTIQGIVRDVNDQFVTVDFNHPLAGKELHFDFEVIEISSK